MEYYIFLSLLAVSSLLMVLYIVLPAAFGPGKTSIKMPESVFPRVTILKPIKDIDDGLEDNLKSFFTLDYPDYDIVFGVDTLDDPCVAVIEKARKAYPSCVVRIVETGVSDTVNPKVDKLAKMDEGCGSPLLWVSDSNTRVGSDALKRLAAEYLKSGSKIVFSPIRGLGSGTLGSMMANSYLNIFVSGNILGAWVLCRKAIIVGKSMLIERETLEKLGGFAAFNCYLAEDYMMGEIYREKGFHISTNYTWITNYSSTASVMTFYRRMERWAKMRMRIDPFAYSFEIFANPLAIAFLSVFFLREAGLALFAAAFVFQLMIEYNSLVLVNNTDHTSLKVLALCPVAMLVKDAILLYVYIEAFFSRSVSWHGREIKIGSKSMIEAAEGNK